MLRAKTVRAEMRQHAISLKTVSKLSLVLPSLPIKLVIVRQFTACLSLMKNVFVCLMRGLVALLSV